MPPSAICASGLQKFVSQAPASRATKPWPVPNPCLAGVEERRVPDAAMGSSNGLEAGAGPTGVALLPAGATHEGLDTYLYQWKPKIWGCSSAVSPSGDSINP